MRSTHAGIPVLDFCAPKSVRTARPALSPILGRIAALALAAGLFAAAPQAAALFQPAHAAIAR